MTSPYPRPIPVLVLALVLAVPVGAAALAVDEWADTHDAVCCLEQFVRDLTACGVRKVERKAAKGCDALACAETCAEEGNGPGYFKAAVKVAKRLRKVTKVADKKGVATAEVRASLTEMRSAARRLLGDAIAEVKARPDFATNDRMLRAAARAEVLVEQAKAALETKKPFVKSLLAYRKAFEGLWEFL